MNSHAFRRDFITKPIFGWAKKALPAMSDTEREALEAGDTWWDADLFTGNPDWNHLLAIPQAKLTAEEKAFLDGPVEQLCAMCDEWKILGMARSSAASVGVHQARKTASSA